MNHYRNIHCLKSFCFIVIALWLTACAGVANNLPAPAVEVAPAATIGQLLGQQLHVDAANVQITNVEEKVWSDACLGAGSAVESCALVETPGYRITITANRNHYVYHTDKDGSQIRLVEAPQPLIGERILTWRGSDENGCQTLEAGADGVAFGPCERSLLGVPFSFDTRMADLTGFAGNYQSFQAETPAGGVDFVGYGANVATPAEQRMIAEWARLVFQEAQMGRSGASWGLVIGWQREGGIAGFCDDVTVYISGDVSVNSCKGQQTTRLQLSAEQLGALYQWVDTLRPFEWTQKDPAVADAMSIKLVFTGAGAQEASAADQQAISEFTQALTTQAQAQPQPAAPPNPATVEVVTTSVQFVQALVNVNIRSGPGTNYPVLGQVFAGQLAKVTGATPDGQWWRVVCPDDASGNCFVVNDPSLTTPATTPSRAPVTGNETGEAVVESIEMRLLESFPVQVQAILRGQLPDACAAITGVPVLREGNSFRMALTVERLPDRKCAPQATPFEEVVGLDVYGLPAGDYEVRINGLRAVFNLAVENRAGETAPADLTFNLTEVKDIVALQPVEIYNGPGPEYQVIGRLMANDLAGVNGVSPDGQWWRIDCAIDINGNCWVTADPEFTERK